jgi:hypothetical protein
LIGLKKVLIDEEYHPRGPEKCLEPVQYRVLSPLFLLFDPPYPLSAG